MSLASREVRVTPARGGDAGAQAARPEGESRPAEALSLAASAGPGARRSSALELGAPARLLLAGGGIAALWWAVALGLS